ncbi:hypothetical protein [Streptomyces sp. NPDC051561]|uniref:hypothetical protein n=1 Tax=Streptomyces sp. NPDC051561 TaxID=3365658 RepID=UPI00378B48F5
MNMNVTEILNLADTATAALIEGLPDGRHSVVCADEEAEYMCTLEFSTLAGLSAICPDCIMEFTENLACVIAIGAGGLVARTHAEDEETVRGWSVTSSGVAPVSKSVTYSAYTTDAVTGDPIPSEEGVIYAAGFSLSQPES